jgi:hypothetical protein
MIFLQAAQQMPEGCVPSWVIYLVCAGYPVLIGGIVKLYLDLQKSQKGRLKSLLRMKNLLEIVQEEDDDE